MPAVRPAATLWTRSTRAIVAGMALLAVFAAAPSAAQDAATMSAEERAEIERLVRDYILNNPEIILEAVNRLQARQEAEQQARTRTALTERADDLFNDPRAPAHGPADAPVTLVEFFDYQCGYCKRILPAMMKLAEEQEDLRIVFIELPILGPLSEVAAKAALAAEKQGVYMAYHQAIMGLRGRLTEQRLYDEAAALGLDVERLKRDMEDPAILAYINDNRALAQAVGVTGTPALVIGETLVPGAISYEQMVQLVETERARQLEREKEG